MINAITIIKKKQGLTYEKFQNYWKDEHAEIVTRSPLVGTYVQSHPIYNDELTFEDTIDGIAEIWFDDTNVGRFCDLLNKIVAETNTYFMVVTHHRLTMAKMDRLFGVTMEQKGISRLVSVNLEEANRIRDIA